MFTVGSILMLHNLYDPDQLWFDFMYGTHFKSFDVEIPRPHTVPKISNKKNNDTSYLGFTRIYEYPNQAVLPFHEFKSISNKQFDKLKNAKYPTFDRTKDGSLLIIEIKTEETNGIIKQWCIDNFKRRFHLGGSGNMKRLILEDETDALLAKMRFF
jgi:hypothetical protein